LNRNMQGDKGSDEGWEAHSISGQYRNLASDCEIRCWNCVK
jgi:hypothetical protein